MTNNRVGDDMLHKSKVRGVINRILHLIARFAPGATTLRPYIHKRRGIKIYGNVFIGEEVYLENEYPENIHIFGGVGIALRTTIIAHFRGPGQIVIEKNVWIGACCTITANKGQVLRIGEGAVLAANSVVTKDVAPYTFVAGVPAKPIAKVTVPITLEYKYDEFKKGLKPLSEKNKGKVSR